MNTNLAASAIALIGCLACGTSGRQPGHPRGDDGGAGDDAAAPSDAHFFAPRPVTQARASATFVAWSSTAENCPLTGPECPAIGETLSVRGTSTPQDEVLLQSHQGARSMAGDHDEWFLVTENKDLSSTVFKTTPMSQTPMAVADPAYQFLGPAVDADSVYWFSEKTNAMFRAARDGTGNDVTLLAADVRRPEAMVAMGGYVWWWSNVPPVTLFRLAITGGTPEIVAFNTTSLFSTSDRVYAGGFEYVDGSYRSLIRSFDSDAAATVIVDHLTQQQEPLYLVADRGELFWTGLDGVLYRVGEGAPASVQAVPNGAGGPFVVRDTDLLVDFSREGFRSIAR